MSNDRKHREWVLRELDGELDAERQAELERALAGDASLAEFARRQRRLDGLLEGLAELPATSASTERARLAVRERIEAGPTRLRAVPRAPLWLAAAAGLAAVVGAGWIVDALWSPVAVDRDETVAGGASRGGAVEPQPSGAPEVAPPAAEVDDREPFDVAAFERSVANLGAVPPEAVASALEGLPAFPGDAWSACREVERWLESEPTPELARGALRYLGARGDGLSARSIEDHLHDAELREAGFEALLALGPDGFDSLAAALLDDELFEPALAAWGSVDDPAAARELARVGERLCQRADDPARSRRVLTRLADLGPRGMGELIERLESGDLPLDQTLAAVGPRHGDALVQAVEGRRTSAALVELARVAAVDALAPRLVEEVTDGRHGVAAFSALAELRGVQSTRALLELRRLGRPSVPSIDGALTRRDDAELWTELARLVVRDRELAVSLAEFLLGDPELARSAALAELARGNELPADLRLLALDAVDGADPPSIDALRRLLASCPPDDARLAATALLRLDAGASAEALLAELPAGPTIAQSLAAAGRRDSRSGLVRLARELRPHLPLTVLDGDQLP